MKEKILVALGTLVGGLVAIAFFAALLGWLVAIIWNHFPFLVALHHMGWWDGFLLQMLGGLIFRSQLNTGNGK